MFRILSDDIRFDDFLKVEKSIFSKFSLYTDHCHLSPLGNRLMAEKLFNTLEYKWEGKM
jgi:lysophospholipase L1-like esterase